MHAKSSSSTWPQILVVLERGDGGVHQERWLEVVGWVEGVHNGGAPLCMHPASLHVAYGHSVEFELDRRLQSTLEMQCNELEEGGLLQNASSSGYHRDQHSFGD